MKHYAGMDVSLKETSIRIVDEKGSTCRLLLQRYASCHEAVQSQLPVHCWSVH